MTQAQLARPVTQARLLVQPQFTHVGSRNRLFDISDKLLRTPCALVILLPVMEKTGTAKV